MGMDVKLSQDIRELAPCYVSEVPDETFVDWAGRAEALEAKVECYRTAVQNALFEARIGAAAFGGTATGKHFDYILRTLDKLPGDDA